MHGLVFIRRLLEISEVMRVIVLTVIAASVLTVLGSAAIEQDSRPLQNILSKCSQETSRSVLNFLSTDFIKRMGLKSLSQLPSSCPWNPARSIYGEVESQKGELRPHDWKCGFCQKRFVSEYYLDLHMQRHHQNHFHHQESNSICLADYCGLIGCDKYPNTMSIHYDETIEDIVEDFYEDEDGRFVPFHQPRYTKANSNRKTNQKKTFGNLEKCSERKIRQWQSQCESIVHQCFDNDTRRSQLLRQDLCQFVKCQNGLTVAGLRPLQSRSNGEGGQQAIDSNDSSVWRVVIQALRLVAVVAVIVLVIVHAFFADISIFTQIARIFFPSATLHSTSTQVGMPDYLGSFLQQRPKNAVRSGRSGDSSFGIGWFLRTIVDAFYRAGQDAYRAWSGKKH